jgi:F-type H+-transporting ATPase subunit delta
VGLVDQKLKRLRVKVLSALPVSVSELSEINEVLSIAYQKQIFTQTEIDETLLGGIRIEVAGQVFDGTLKAKLWALKNGLGLSQTISN